jgi:APA family basic amino acid/polyamine antiporter
MTTTAVIVLRRKRPEMARPYRTLGYPIIPMFFVLAAVCILVSTLFEAPRESIIGLAVVAIAWPFYRYWARKKESAAHS